MRRLNRIIAALAATALMAGVAACKRSRKPRVEVVETGSGPLSSEVSVADVKTAAQLLRGFHELEPAGWRWTQSKFAVTLKPPPGSAATGARLQLKLAVPDAEMQKTGPITLSAVLGQAAFEPQKFDKPGDYTYEREVAASLLAAEAVTFEFSLDKFLAAGQVELRELGVIVSAAGLIAK